MYKAFRFILPALLAAACCGPKDGEYSFHILTTNDIHGTYFDSTYVDGRTQNSMLAANYFVDSVRTAAGKDNVILIDAGDFLQGNNAAYYYNYVETGVPHVFSRIVDYMDYDAIVWGNHDVETGHPVYDRISREIEGFGIPFLGGNAIKEDGKPYFPVYTILKKNNVKIAVLGFNNANIKAWLDESIWSGMHFESLIPLVQQDVDMVIAKEKPQIVIVAVHSGTGDGDGSVLESQGLDLYKSLKGVDVLVCAHDHRPFVTDNGTIALLNSGSHSRNLGHGIVDLTIKKHKVVAKSVKSGLIPIRKEMADPEMRKAFQKDYEAVKAFTLKEVGELKTDLRLSDAFAGMSDESWDKVLDTNLNGFFNVVHPLVMPMCRKRIGRIITISSVSGVIGNRGQVNYSASKAGIIGATKALATELASRNITVNSVAPGVIETEMIKEAPLDIILQAVPMKRVGKPSEVAATVVFLLSEGAAYITRQVISVNGGLA